MLYRSELSGKKLRFLLSSNITKGIGAALIIGGLAATVIALITRAVKERGIMMPQTATTGTGVYGAVAIAKIFKGADFPLSKQDIIQRYGNREIEYHIGKTEKLGDILHDIPDQTFSRTTELEHALHETMEKKKH